MDGNASRAVQKAILRGELPEPTRCEACGSEKQIVRHHWSSLPEHRLDVIALCRSCRARVLHGSVPEPRTGRIYPRRVARCSDRPAFFHLWWKTESADE